jgi:hypothetical protein
VDQALPLHGGRTSIAGVRMVRCSKRGLVTTHRNTACVAGEVTMAFFRPLATRVDYSIHKFSILSTVNLGHLKNFLRRGEGKMINAKG